MTAAHNSWEFWIDRGGTFTDVVGVAPDGTLHVRKQPSAAQPGGLDPGLFAAQEILRQSTQSGDVACFKVGTTVATNALLERQLTPTVFVTTRGFADALLIGTQHRPDIFALNIRRAAPLYAHVLELDERLAVDGTVVTPMDLDATRAALQLLHAQGWRAVAIALLHGWRHQSHEKIVARLAREIGFDEVSVAHELVPLVRFVPRASSTVLNAVLAPTLRAYVGALGAQIAQHFPGAALHFMQSSGGLVRAAGFRALASVLSGPAGGLIGMARIAGALGFERLIGFDMGGTSTDVALFDGVLPRRFEHEIAGAQLSTPMLDVHSIAAGGGSVLQWRDDRLGVGPHSAGADPGPACYARGGPATLTDVQVTLGRLQPAFLPAVFGPERNQPIDANASACKLTELAVAAGITVEAAAESYLNVASETMANAIRHVSTRQGLDPADFTLFAFGGAAGQHALRVAAACGMRRVLVHPLSSVLSAVGIGIADWLETRRQSIALDLDPAALAVCAVQMRRLEADARAALTTQGLLSGHCQVERFLELRQGESEVSLEVRATNAAATAHAEFAAAYQRRFGHAPPANGLRIDALRVEVRAARPSTELAASAAAGSQHSATIDSRHAAQRTLPASARAWFGGWQQVPVVAAHTISESLPLDGPALIVEPHCTLVLEPGWRLRRVSGGALLAESHVAVQSHVAKQSNAATQSHEAVQAQGAAAPLGTSLAAATALAMAAPDPAQLEIFNNLFMHIAEEMGAVLQQTAQSVNIKERLDFSCALFDASGGLVANAPHMPVHLGSMGSSVRAIIERHDGQMAEGDAWMLNSPYHGGTHLPDITVVAPVFLAEATGQQTPSKPDFYLASRAHHADIGGSTPGSMPPFSVTIAEEGVLFEDFYLVERGSLRETTLRAALAAGPWPARNPQQNIADLRAQLAANARGRSELQRAVQRHGMATLHAYMRHVQDNASECVRAAIAKLRPWHCRVELDGGQQITVSIEIDAAARRAKIDFTGSSPQGAHNFNAPRAVCMAAVLYVFRTLVDRPIPLNEGCLAPLTIVIPRGSILDPLPGAAVVAGNVETSQCIVDALYGALGVLAAAQGTMNNFTFGNAELQYYETICGGAGAGPDFDGCDAVQTHMTNSRLTDAEVLEQRYPVRLREFKVRENSAGAGAHRGGHGVLREIEFLAPLSGAMLANRRRIPPRGIAGGGDGACGETLLIRADGRRESLAACASFEVQAGDRVVVLTPGGGGFGK